MKHLLVQQALDNYIEENHPWVDWVVSVALVVSGLSLIVSIFLVWLFPWWWKMSLSCAAAIILIVFFYEVMQEIYLKQMIKRNRARKKQ